jgi:hypothetical protein
MQRRCGKPGTQARDENSCRENSWGTEVGEPISAEARAADSE